MKSKLNYLLLISVASILLTSCGESRGYPEYSITTVTYIPDEHKEAYQKFITETVRAASQSMAGGDYEDVDQTIRQAKWTADEVFGVKSPGLRIDISESYFDRIYIRKDELNAGQLKIYNDLAKDGLK